jgi:ribonuclease P protein component
MSTTDKQFSLTKQERIYSKNRIDSLFENGKSFISYPLRVIFVLRESEENKPEISILISVPKKKLKASPKRNRIKRLIREAFRLNKSGFNEITGLQDKGIDLAFIYLKDAELSTFDEIEKAILKTAKLLKERIDISL